MARAITADLLAQVCAEIDARLAELRPAVEEYERLLGAADALEADAARAAPAGDSAEGSAGAQAAAAEDPAAGSAGARVAAAEGPAGAKPVRAVATRRRARRRAAAGGRGSSALRTAAAQAIVAALEHGSHTVGELVVVTAMSGPEIRESLRALQRAGRVTRAKREGRTAYALSGTA